MQVAIQTSTKEPPMVFEMSKDKINILMNFIDSIADCRINENSEEYKSFLSDEIVRALKTKRVASGNSLREILV